MPTAKKSIKKPVATHAPAASVDLSLHSDDCTYFLRTCESDLRSYGGFQWPESGLVRCGDWSPRPMCGSGLHGLLHGDGKQSLLSQDANAKWLVVRVRRSEIVYVTDDNGGKWKVPEAFVCHVGTMPSAVTYLLEIDPEAQREKVPGGNATAAQDAGASSATGYQGASSATGSQGASSATGSQGASSATGYQGASSATGDYGASSATGYQGASSATGDYGASSATGDYGASSATGDYGASSATGYQGASSATGDYGASSATGYQGASSATGDYGASSATGYQGASSATGDYGASSATGEAGIALARNGSRARVGRNGVLILIDDRSGRPRAVVGYADEDGIEAGKWYKLDVDGKIVPSPDSDSMYLPWVEPAELVKKYSEEAAVEARAKIAELQRAEAK